MSDISSETDRSGRPAGNTASTAASEPGDFWVFETGERRRGVCSEDPGTRPVWADWSVWWQMQGGEMCAFMRRLTRVHDVMSQRTEPILASWASSAWLNRALLWMAAMASGWSCRMACHASLRRATRLRMRFRGNKKVRLSTKLRTLTLRWRDRTAGRTTSL